MIPAHKRKTISAQLYSEFGIREDIGTFVFTFAALDDGRDVAYALEELEKSTDERYKKAINIVLEGVVDGY